MITKNTEPKSTTSEAVGECPESFTQVQKQTGIKNQTGRQIRQTKPGTEGMNLQVRQGIRQAGSNRQRNTGKLGMKH